MLQGQCSDEAKKSTRYTKYSDVAVSIWSEQHVSHFRAMSMPDRSSRNSAYTHESKSNDTGGSNTTPNPLYVRILVVVLLCLNMLSAAASLYISATVRLLNVCPLAIMLSFIITARSLISLILRYCCDTMVTPYHTSVFLTQLAVMLALVYALCSAPPFIAQ